MDEYETLINGMTVLNIEENTYFEQAITTEPKKDTLCVGWDYMRKNITPKLKTLVLDRKKLRELYYNRAIADHFKANLAVKPEWERQVDTFVYLIQEKEKQAQQLAKANELTAGGYHKLSEEWVGRKVEFIVRGEGGFGAYERKGKGSVIKDHRGSLFILPARCRTSGYNANNKDIWVR